MPQQTWEFIFLALVTCFGLVVISVESWLFASGIIPLSQVEPETFVRNSFTPAAQLAFWVAAICAGVWWVFTLKLRGKYLSSMHNGGYQKATIVWYLLGACTLVSYGFALWYCGKDSPEAIPYALVLLLVNVVINYWVATIVSTPWDMVAVVPMAYEVQSMLGRK